MGQTFVIGMLGFYAGLVVAMSVAVVCAWYELKAQIKHFQARKPRVMASYNS